MLSPQILRYGATHGITHGDYRAGIQFPQQYRHMVSGAERPATIIQQYQPGGVLIDPGSLTADKQHILPGQLS
jgi:hypothetical protein